MAAGASPSRDDAAAGGPAPAPLRILCVDDDRIHALLFVEACRIAGGIDVETAGDAAEALDLVGRWTPDLLVVDRHLPDADGCALLPALRERLGARVPAVLCSADDAPECAGPAADAGFDRCWTKPIALPLLLGELDRLRAPPR